jgi:rare lipoprotein A
VEPYLRATSRPYTVLGKTYVPITDNRPYRVTGMASWYGRKFHGQKTASGEIYDMFKMTAAHPILPIPSYVRVTHLNNGKQVIVRVNDRGPFLHDRVLDLSYTAALKLGYLQAGSGRVLVERLLPDEIERINRGRGGDEPAVPAVIVAPTPAPVSPPAPVPKPAPVSTPALEPASAPTSAPVVPPVPAFPAVPPDDPVSPHAGAKPVAGAPSYYLQLGAYQQREYAQTAQAAYMLQWAHLLPGMGLVVTDQLYRLLAGPFRTREDADNAAGQLGIEGIKSLVIER